MEYTSTRNREQKAGAAQAIAQGISQDGGLFVPEAFPQYGYDTLGMWKNLSYSERAQAVLKDFLTDFTQEEIRECAEKAYAPEKFSGGRPAPLTYLQNGGVNMYLLELWHGPTCAFKDMALQILPHLLTKSLKKLHSQDTAVVLVATSGDTGKAALEGFRDVDGTRILVFYPQNGVSAMQERQMNTQEGGNVCVCAVEGNFDDAQNGVKKIFADSEMIRRLRENHFFFSSANSINWGRLLPQIVYYFSAYCDMMSTGEIDHEGEKVNIVVPTGNFGNILAAFYAKKMGLPVNRLICASNTNNVLTDFLRTGVYDRNRSFYATISPSMDILVSSNLERLLYDLTDGDSRRVAGWMDQLARTGRYQVDEPVLAELRGLFYAGFCSDEQTKETIREIHSTENYVCDTHTAVAINVYHQYVAETGDRDTPSIIVSTASPYKFAPSVISAITGGNEEAAPGSEFSSVQALSALTGVPVPEPIAALETKPTRFQNVCRVDQMGGEVLKSCGI